MNIDNQIRRGATFPNLEFTLDLQLDLSTKLHRVVQVEAGLIGHTPSGPATPPERVVGILQNAPIVGEAAVVRYHGWTYAVAGDTISEGDLLRVEPNSPYDRVVPWVKGTDGHNHYDGDAYPEKLLINVVSMVGAPVTGLVASDFTWELKYYESPTFGSVGGTPTLVDLGGGWYEVTTPAVGSLMAPHYLTILPDTATHIVTPSQYNWTPRARTTGTPAIGAYSWCLGQALSAGVAGEEVLMMLKPQLF